MRAFCGNIEDEPMCLVLQHKPASRLVTIAVVNVAFRDLAAANMLSQWVSTLHTSTQMVLTSIIDGAE